MKLLNALVATSLLSGCAHPMYKSPAAGPTATLTATSDDVLYKVFYFEDAANCNGRKWLPFEARKNGFEEQKTVTLPADRPVSLLFHREGAFNYCKIYATFEPEADAHYFVSYGAGGNQCGIKMTRGEANANGKMQFQSVRNLRKREFKPPLTPGPGECRPEQED